jgi:GNAT superfamily N-acetyltransferase
MGAWQRRQYLQSMAGKKREQSAQERQFAEIVARCKDHGQKMITKSPGPPPLVVASRLDQEDLEIAIWTYLSRDERPHRLVLLAATLTGKMKQSALLDDIWIHEVDCNRGFGSLAMKYFLSTAKRLGVKRITGELIDDDWDHMKRSVHFYRKHGFRVELTEDLDQPKPSKKTVGSIELLL